VSDPSAPGTVAGDRRPPNVLLVILDCARAKNFRASEGARTASTPRIDALAQRGTRFPRAVAPANWTVPSHMSIFTGAYPNVHGLRTFHRGEAPSETIAGWLSRRGYESMLLTEMIHLVGDYGLEAGFDRKVARRMGVSDDERTATNRLASRSDALYAPWLRDLLERLPPAIVPLNLVNHPQEVAYKREVCGTHLLEAFETWIGTRDRARPFFATFNLVDAHEPYPLVPNGHRVGPLARWYARTPRYYLLAVPGLKELVPWPELLAGYLQCIEEADRKVGRIVDALAAAGELDRTLLIVTADHGQSFGEAGNIFHGCGTTDSITRVPLVVVPPAEWSVPARVGRWTSLCDVFSWVKSTVSGRPPYGEDGVAPRPFMLSAPPTGLVFCEGAPASDPNRALRGIQTGASWNHRQIAVYHDEEKLVLNLVTGDVMRWSMARGVDPDDRRAERLDPATTEATRREFFGAYEATDLARRGSAPDTGIPGENELDRRLRSWGYE